MSILLFSDAPSCARCLPTLLPAAPEAALALDIVLAAGESALADLLRTVLPEIAIVDPASPRFSRLNFDALRLVVVDLDADTLESHAGRRLLDALGRLAEESLALAFAGPAVAQTGAIALDGVHAAMGLIPGAAVIPNLNALEDLRGLLARLSARGARLLALDAPVGLRYEPAADTVTVCGAGSVLLAAFHADTAQERVSAPAAQTARLHVLTDGQTSGWPNS